MILFIKKGDVFVVGQDTVVLYKYMNIKYGLEAIKNSALYLSCKNDLNDSYELMYFDKETNKWVELRALRILCLTNSYRKKMMWGYYNCNKGVCLTIEVPKKYVKPICYTTKIANQNNVDDILRNGKYRCKRTISRDYSNLSLKEKYGYIKDAKWIEEKEYRIVVDSTTITIDKNINIVDDKYFFKVKIKNVYLGVAFNKSDKESKELIKVAQRKNIEVTQMIQSNKNYMLNTYKIKGEK